MGIRTTTPLLRVRILTGWVLLPAGKPDYATFVAVYAAATMIGVLSHVPGGIGVFETVVIGTLPASVPVGDAAAALLLFRLVYYLVPFALAFVLVALFAPHDANAQHLRALARVARMMRQPELRSALRQARSADAIHVLLTDQPASTAA